jgi:hypothetical protein
VAPSEPGPLVRPNSGGLYPSQTVGQGRGWAQISWNQSHRSSPRHAAPLPRASHLLLCHNVFQSGEANCPIRAGASGLHLCRHLINTLLLTAADKFQKQVVKGFCLYPARKMRGVTPGNMNRLHFSSLLPSFPPPGSAESHQVQSVRGRGGRSRGRRGEPPPHPFFPGAFAPQKNSPFCLWFSCLHTFLSPLLC